MGYKQHVKHVITLTKEELIDMLESRYGVTSPIDQDKVEFKVHMAGQYSHQPIDLSKGVQVVWNTEIIPEVAQDEDDEP